MSSGGVTAAAVVPTQRRPRIIRCDSRPDIFDVRDRVNAFAGAHDDDVILLSDDMSHASFVDTYVDSSGCVSDPLYVHIRRTERHDDPLAWFADITAECRMVIFQCRVTSAFIQRKLPGLDPHWHSVSISVNFGDIQHLQRIRFSRFHDHTHFFVWEAEDVVAQLHKVYTWSMWPEASFICTIDEDDEAFVWNQDMTTWGPTIPANTCVEIYGHRIQTKERPLRVAMWSGVARIRAHFMAKIRRQAERRQSLQFLLCSELDCSFTVGGHFNNWVVEQKWTTGSCWRTPRAHACILDVCLGLASLWLPPYVLLEIIDWLPFMDVHREIWKIRLIQRLQTCLRRTLNVRNTISRQTRSRTKNRLI